MKPASKNQKITLGKICITSLIFYCVLFALRFYQLAFLTNAQTGFFTDHSDITVIPMYVLALTSVLIILLLSRLCKNLPAGQKREKADYFHAATSLLFAVSLAIEGYRGITLVKDETSIFGALKPALKSMGGYTKLLIPVLAILSALVFIADFISSVVGKNYLERLKLPMLIPVLWAFFLTISYFTITASYLKAVQLMFTIFSNAFLMLFLFEYARMNSGIGKKDAIWAFYATGIITSGLTFVSAVPTLLFELFAPEKIVVYCPFKLYSLTAALFAVTATLNIFRAGKEEIRKTEKEKITENE